MAGTGRTVAVPVTAIIQSYLGMIVFMNIDALGRLAWNGPRVSSANILLDAARLDDFYRAVKHVAGGRRRRAADHLARAFQGDHADQHE